MEHGPPEPTSEPIEAVLHSAADANIDVAVGAHSAPRERRSRSYGRRI